jgi:hypothetical protein
MDLPFLLHLHHQAEEAEEEEEEEGRLKMRCKRGWMLCARGPDRVIFVRGVGRASPVYSSWAFWCAERKGDVTNIVCRVLTISLLRPAFRIARIFSIPFPFFTLSLVRSCHVCHVVFIGTWGS